MPTIHVWTSLGEPGLFGFADEANHTQFAGPDWSYLGDLEAAPSIPEHAKNLVRSFHFNGWAKCGNLGRHGDFLFPVEPT